MIFKSVYYAGIRKYYGWRQRRSDKKLEKVDDRIYFVRTMLELNEFLHIPTNAPGLYDRRDELKSESERLEKQVSVYSTV